MMKNKDAAPEYMKSETAVFWDINRCPIPDGYDPCLVGPRIDSVLMSLGYSGPLTITAIGYLNDIPDKVLRALSSTGIFVRQASCGIKSVLMDMFDWECDNPPPATLMLISDYLGVDAFAYPLYIRQKEGYNILMAYPHPLPRQPTGLVPSAQWLWKPFLTDAMDSENKQETRRPEKKCSQDAFICNSCTCRFARQSFEMFIDHLRGEEHFVKSIIRGPPKKVKPLKDAYKVVLEAGDELPPIYADTPLIRVFGAVKP